MSIYENFPEIKTVFVHDDLPSDIQFGNEVHLDIESTGLNFGSYHLPEERDEVNVISIGYDHLPDGRFQKAVVCKVNKESHLTVFKKLITDSKVITYIHHAAFDAPAIYAQYGVIPANIKCTKALSKILGRSNNGYASLVKSICGLELPKGMLSTSDWHLPFKEWSPEMRKYCVYDVVYGKWIHDYLFKLCDSKKQSMYLDLTNSWHTLVQTLHTCSKKGILSI